VERVVTVSVISTVGTKDNLVAVLWICIQVRRKDLQVKTQLVLWMFILFKVTR